MLKQTAADIEMFVTSTASQRCGQGYARWQYRRAHSRNLRSLTSTTMDRWNSPGRYQKAHWCLPETTTQLVPTGLAGKLQELSHRLSCSFWNKNNCRFGLTVHNLSDLDVTDHHSICIWPIHPSRESVARWINSSRKLRLPFQPSANVLKANNHYYLELQYSKRSIPFLFWWSQWRLYPNTSSQGNLGTTSSTFPQCWPTHIVNAAKSQKWMRHR